MRTFVKDASRVECTQTHRPKQRATSQYCRRFGDVVEKCRFCPWPNHVLNLREFSKYDTRDTPAGNASPSAFRVFVNTCLRAPRQFVGPRVNKTSASRHASWTLRQRPTASPPPFSRPRLQQNQRQQQHIEGDAEKAALVVN